MRESIKITAFLLFVALIMACKKSPKKPGFIELLPRPSAYSLWTACSEIPSYEQGGNTVLKIDGQNYEIGKLIGEGGMGFVHEVKGLHPNPYDLVVKILKEGFEKDAYLDLLLHSTMEIIGAPTRKVGLGFLQKADGHRVYVLIKERVRGVNLSNVLSEANWGQFHIFNSDVRGKSERILFLTGQVYSHVINSGVYISDMHARNTMWDEIKKEPVIIDGNIEPNSTADSIDISNTFARTIDLSDFLGHKVFYYRYYDPIQKSSEEARTLARKRIDLFYKDRQTDCKAPQWDPQEGASPYEIDVHKVFPYKG